MFCLNEYGEHSSTRRGRIQSVRQRLADDDMCMATPAIAGDRLLIRTAVRLYSIKKQDQK